jgi:GMP synthase-like glutamine amidotransferase
VRILVIETQPTVPIGSFGPPLKEAGLQLVSWKTSQEPPPRSLTGFSGVIALGGAANPDEDERYPWLAHERQLLATALDQRLPTIGLCLGAELLAETLGSAAAPLRRPEIGWVGLELAEAAGNDPLYRHLPRRFDGFQWHTYGFGLPPGAVLIAGTNEMAQAFSWGNCVWGLQFHLEASEPIMRTWIAEYADLLREQGLDPRTLELETRRRAGLYQQRAGAFAGAFATMVQRSARAPIRSGSL